MKIKKEIVYLLLIILLAGILRFCKLGSYPTLTVDAAAVGYNAYSIIKTGRDEFGEKLPVFFKSYGEEKLPLYIYEAVVPVALFGLNIFSARFSTALMATLTVLILYFFVEEILKYIKIKDKSLKKWLPLASSFFLAIMPWHIQFSREIFGQESLFWVLLGCFLSFKFLNKKKEKYWFYAMLSFSAGLMTYHAAKVFVPIWIAYILILIWKRDQFKKAFKLGILAIILTGSIWLWMSNSTLGANRANDVSAFGKNSNVRANLWEAQIISQGQPVLYTRFLHNKVEAYTRDILQRYFSHFNPEFLFFEGNIEREKSKVPYSGMLLWTSLPFFAIGLYSLIKKKIWPVLIFLIISPIVSAITFGATNSVRSIYTTAGLAVICGLGLLVSLKSVKSKILWVIFTILFLQSFLTYLNSYYVHQNYFYAKDWQYETKQIVSDITKVQNNYKEIVVTANMGGNPYIYFLFYNQYDPLKWQAQANENIELDEGTSFIHIRKLDNIRFISEACVENENLKNDTLYLCKAGTQTGDFKIIKNYYWPNGKKSFVLGVKNNLLLD